VSFFDVFSDPQQMGLLTLILVLTVFLGVGVSRYVPRDKGPTLFGTLAALAFVAILAYVGVTTAIYVLWLVLAAAVLLGLFALVA
jgi:hypothetical protein